MRYDGLDVTNAFIQTNMLPNKNSKKWVILKIISVKVEMLVDLDSEMHKKHVVFENGKKVLYVVVLRVIYEFLVSVLLFYKKFCGDL